MEWDAREYGLNYMAERSAFSLVPLGGMWGCPHIRLGSPLSEGREGKAVMWQAVLTNGAGEAFFISFCLFCLLVLIFRRGLEKVNRILVWRSS